MPVEWASAGGTGRVKTNVSEKSDTSNAEVNMANIDKSPVYLFENLPEDGKYRFAILKALETFEGTVANATNKRDDAALSAIQTEASTILRTASECMEAGIPYVRCE